MYDTDAALPESSTEFPNTREHPDGAALLGFKEGGGGVEKKKYLLG